MNSSFQSGAAPVEVADVLGHLDGADVLARRVEHPHAAGAGDPDVAALVELHPVGEVADLEDARADPVGEHARRSRACRRRSTSNTRMCARVVSLTYSSDSSGEKHRPLGCVEVVYEQLRLTAPGAIR